MSPFNFIEENRLKFVRIALALDSSATSVVLPNTARFLNKKQLATGLDYGITITDAIRDIVFKDIMSIVENTNSNDLFQS